MDVGSSFDILLWLAKRHSGLPLVLPTGSTLGLYKDKGKENGNDYVIMTVKTVFETNCANN